MKVTVSKEHHRNEKIRVMPRGKITVEFQEVTHPHKDVYCPLWKVM
jgi:hypothetical protein